MTITQKIKSKSSKICKGLSNLECSKCNKIFNNRNSRFKHERQCDNTSLVLYNNTQTPPTITNNNNTTINGNNNNTNSNNTINNTIFVNNFGKENIGYLLEHPDFVSFMNKCIEKKQKAFAI